MTQLSTKFDFLTNLFNTNKEAFNEYREEVIEEYFDSLPPDRAERARNFQLAIDEEMDKCDTAEERTAKLMELIHERSGVLDQSIDKLRALVKK